MFWRQGNRTQRLRNLAEAADEEPTSPDMAPWRGPSPDNHTQDLQVEIVPAIAKLAKQPVQHVAEPPQRASVEKPPVQRRKPLKTSLQRQPDPPPQRVQPLLKDWPSPMGAVQVTPCLIGGGRHTLTLLASAGDAI